jgi:hypothetical protein
MILVVVQNGKGHYELDVQGFGVIHFTEGDEKLEQLLQYRGGAHATNYVTDAVHALEGLMEDLRRSSAQVADLLRLPSCVSDVPLLPPEHQMPDIPTGDAE